MASTGVNVCSCFALLYTYALRSSRINSIPSCLQFFCRNKLTVGQVLRYSALAVGVFYGLYHQASLTASSKLSAVNREYEHKQSLIEKARAEYSKKNAAPASKTESGDGMSNPQPPMRIWAVDLCCEFHVVF